MTSAQVMAAICTEKSTSSVSCVGKRVILYSVDVCQYNREREKGEENPFKINRTEYIGKKKLYHTCKSNKLEYNGECCRMSLRGQ